MREGSSHLSKFFSFISLLMFLICVRSIVFSFFRSFVLSFFHSFVLSFFRSFVLSFFRSSVLSFSRSCSFVSFVLLFVRFIRSFVSFVLLFVYFIVSIFMVFFAGCYQVIQSSSSHFS